MARGTKKVGIAGKYGPRYGVTIRKRIKEVSAHRQKPSVCPECRHRAVKRQSTGIWKCRHCDLVFAAGAYTTRTRSFKREVSASALDKAYKEEFTEEEMAELYAEPEAEGTENEEPTPEDYEIEKPDVDDEPAEDETEVA